MFCDLVGSTSLAAKLDAEDWRDLVGAYLDEAVQGGHPVWRPRPQEARRRADGPVRLSEGAGERRRARRARRPGDPARARRANARNVARGLPALAARIGLESGPVVVDSAGEVFGDAPNVAARVQSAAEPGTLLVTAAVQRQVAGLFVAEDKGPHELKGVPGKPDALPPRARQRRRAARRRALADAARRPRRGAGAARAALGAREGAARGSSCRSSASPASASRG